MTLGARVWLEKEKYQGLISSRNEGNVLQEKNREKRAKTPKIKADVQVEPKYSPDIKSRLGISPITDGAALTSSDVVPLWGALPSDLTG